MPELIDAMHFQELSGHNHHDVCRRAACTYSDIEKMYTVSAWDQQYSVYPLQNRIEAIGKPPRKLHRFFDLFIIHYLLRAKEIDPANQWISEKDIPGGTTFFRGPHAIPTDLISSRFHNDLQGFTERCAHLNGTPLDLADAAFAFQITPRIPVAVLYWQGDDEFPPESKILFDKTISEHLATDIIFALAVGICERLGETEYLPEDQTYRKEGQTMLIELGDLSKGMGMLFMKEFMETAQHMQCSEGQVLFRTGDTTHHFYTLIQGEFRLTIGVNEQHVYTVRHPGDIFGWSSLVGGSTYSATAVCTKPSEILRFDSDALMELLGRHPESGFLFYKKLAEMLGNRLLGAYRIIRGEEY